jgi:IS5 family transposase
MKRIHNGGLRAAVFMSTDGNCWPDSFLDIATISEKRARNGKFQGETGRHHVLSAEERASNRTKSKVRSKVEHVFHVMKRQFGYTRVRYRGLDKNAQAGFVDETKNKYAKYC